MSAWIFLPTSSLVTWSLYQMISNFDSTSSQSPMFFSQRKYKLLICKKVAKKVTEVFDSNLSASIHEYVNNVRFGFIVQIELSQILVWSLSGGL